MAYKVALRLNETGEVRVIERNHRVEVWDETQAYMWADGNFACDCNRASMFFTEEEWKDEYETCGDGKFDVLYVELPTGKRISLDDPMTEHSVS